MSVCSEGWETVQILQVLLLPSSSHGPQRCWCGGSSQSCHVHALSLHSSQYSHVHTSPSALRGISPCAMLGFHEVFEAFWGAFLDFFLPKLSFATKELLGNSMVLHSNDVPCPSKLTLDLQYLVLCALTEIEIDRAHCIGVYQSWAF